MKKINDFLRGFLPIALTGVIGMTAYSLLSRKSVAQNSNGLESRLVSAQPEAPIFAERDCLDEVSSEPEMGGNVSRVSQNGIEFIKRYEKFSPVIYLCPAKKPTIGYGHVVLPGERFETITEKEAEAILRRDLARAEGIVNKYAKAELNQNQYDALVSLAINAGNFGNSTLVRYLNSGNYAGAAGEFSRWVYANGKKLKGLENRRDEEARIFMSSSE